jgi:hypothetical protein
MWNTSVEMECERVVMGHMEEEELANEVEACGIAGRVLTHVARHVRKETRILPLDAAYRLVVLRIRDRCSLCVPLHGFQDRGECPAQRASRSCSAYHADGMVRRIDGASWRTRELTDRVARTY